MSTTSDTTTATTPAAPAPAAPAPPPAPASTAWPQPGRTEVRTHVVVDELSPGAVEQLRTHVDDASSGGNRLVWFLIGFVAAVLAGGALGVVLLAIADEDDDGTVELDVPTVDVDVQP